MISALSDVQLVGLVMVATGISGWVGVAIGRRTERDRMIELAFRRLRSERQTRGGGVDA